MKRPYLAFIIIGIFFVGIAASGRGNLFYVAGAAFFIAAFIGKRRAGNQ